MTSPPDPEGTLKGTDDARRQQWIRVAAYYKAEARGFAPGKALDDWLEAEIEYTKFQIKSFLSICQEDGIMSIADLQGLAYAVGVPHPECLDNEIDLVRKIQNATRHRPCFQSESRMSCEESECQWRSECRKLIAVWNRRAAY